MWLHASPCSFRSQAADPALHSTIALQKSLKHERHNHAQEDIAIEIELDGLQDLSLADAQAHALCCKELPQT